MTRLSVLGAPSSAGAFNIGQEDAPAALRERHLLQLLEEAGLTVADRGDLPLRRWRPDRDSPRAQNVGEVAANAAAVRDHVGEALRDPHARILVIGGDCTTGVGTLAGATTAFARRPTWIYFDLHADLNTPLSVGAGALDWMGMAHALALAGTVPALRDLAGTEPLTTPPHIHLFAHEWNAATEWERRQLETLALQRITCDDVASDPATAAETLLRDIHPTRPVTLHFDVDVINFIDAPLSENDGREGGLPLQSALIALKTEATNERSRAALAALPARFDGVFRKHMLVRDGESRDSAWYAVVDDDWHDVKQHVSTRVAQRASARSPAEDRRVEA